MHFTLDGMATRMESPTLLRWFLLPLLGGALVLLLPLAGHADRALNRTYAGGAPERVEARRRLMRIYLELCGTLLILVLAALHAGVWWVASTESGRIPPALLVACAGAFAAILLLIGPLTHALSRLGTDSEANGART